MDNQITDHLVAKVWLNIQTARHRSTLHDTANLVRDERIDNHPVNADNGDRIAPVVSTIRHYDLAKFYVTRQRGSAYPIGLAHVQSIAPHFARVEHRRAEVGRTRNADEMTFLVVWLIGSVPVTSIVNRDVVAVLYDQSNKRASESRLCPGAGP